MEGASKRNFRMLMTDNKNRLKGGLFMFESPPKGSRGGTTSNPATPTNECSFTVSYKFLNPVLNQKVKTLSEMAGFFVISHLKAKFPPVLFPDILFRST